MRNVMRGAWCVGVAALLWLAGCATPAKGPSQDWQKDLQKAIQQEKGN